MYTSERLWKEIYFVSYEYSHTKLYNHQQLLWMLELCVAIV